MRASVLTEMGRRGLNMAKRSVHSKKNARKSSSGTKREGLETVDTSIKGVVIRRVNVDIDPSIRRQMAMDAVIDAYSGVQTVDNVALVQHTIRDELTSA